MVAISKDILKMGTVMAKEFGKGIKIIVIYLKGSTLMIKNVDMGYSNGKVGIIIKGSTSKI